MTVNLIMSVLLFQLAFASG